MQSSGWVGASSSVGDSSRMYRASSSASYTRRVGFHTDPSQDQTRTTMPPVVPRFGLQHARPQQQQPGSGLSSPSNSPRESTRGLSHAPPVRGGNRHHAIHIEGAPVRGSAFGNFGKSASSSSFSVQIGPDGDIAAALREQQQQQQQQGSSPPSQGGGKKASSGGSSGRRRKRNASERSIDESREYSPASAESPREEAEEDRPVVATMPVGSMEPVRVVKGQESPPPNQPDIQIALQESKETYAAAKLAPPPSNKEKRIEEEQGNHKEPVFKSTHSIVIEECMRMGLRKTMEKITKEGGAGLRPLDPSKDFTYVAKVDLALNTQGTAPENFIFRSYAPMCYRHIREFLGIDMADLSEALCSPEWKLTGAGKSSSLLYYTGKYVIKTMNKEESRFLRRILHLYYHHISNNPHTLIPSIYGHYAITLKSTGSKIPFFVMNNVFRLDLRIHKKFDLKGSTVGRFAAPQESTLKDLDLRQHFFLGERRRKILLGQVQRDTDFLKRCSIMDYSFLVGIAQPQTEEETRRRATSFQYRDERCLHADDGGMLAEEAPLKNKGEIYYIGIIDILQEYTGLKRVENFAKGVLGNDRKQISAVSPDYYAMRFCDYIHLITDTTRKLPKWEAPGQ